MTNSIKKLAGLGLMALTLSATAAENSEIKESSTYAGADVTENAHFLYAGHVHAIDGDINKDGYLLRLGVGYGKYSYDTVASPNGEVEADLGTAEIAVGYQWLCEKNPTNRLSLYLGLNYEDHSLDFQDTNNVSRGDEIGAKVQGEAQIALTEEITYSGLASYSTAFDTYYTKHRATMGFDGFVAGPEFIALGSETFD